MSSLLRPEDLCNIALDRISWPESIGDIYEGTKAARVALRVYGQARDETMRAKDYPFARREIALQPNGQTAPSPWLYEWGYPSDCLRIRQIMIDAPPTYPNFDPKPVLFTDFNEQRINPPQKAILTYLTPAFMVYTGQVIDPSTFDANYTEALIQALAKSFAALLGSAEMVPIESALEATATDAALGSQANYPPSLVAQRPVGGARER